MNIKYVIAGVMTLCVLAMLPACKDDHPYHPIQLVYAGQETSPLTADNNLSISIFSEGEEFRIAGGNGQYLIDNQDPAIADFRYDGNLLTLLPHKLGKTDLTVSDHTGNSLTVHVTVGYPTVTYLIEKMSGIAYGGELTQNMTKEIQEDILRNALVKEGGKYVFTFTQQDLMHGLVTVYPTDAENPLNGIFEQDKTQVDEQGVKIRLTLTDGQAIQFMLKQMNPAPAAADTLTGGYFIQQDLTEKYKGQYPELEQACLIQHLSAPVHVP